MATKSSRDAILQKVRAKLDELGPPWLPMPISGPANMLEPEWVEYRERRARHLPLNPSYDNGWNRPALPSAEKVWQFLAPTLPSVVITPGYAYLTDDERRELDDIAKQALLVTLDCFMREGRMPTFNAVFDALAAGWSDTFRDTVAHRRAFKAYDMKERTVRAVRRDLLRAGVNFEALWRLVTGSWSKGADCPNSLFYLTLIPGRSYRARLKSSQARVQFEKIMAGDDHYRRLDNEWQLLLADGETPALETRQEIAGEHPYNVVHLGKESKRLLEIQEGARLLFDTDAFREDYETATQARDAVLVHLGMQRIDPGLSAQPARKLKKVNQDGGTEKWSRVAVPTEREYNVWTIFPKTLPDYKAKRKAAWTMLEKYDRLDTFLAGLGSVYDQIKTRTGLLPIKSGFIRVINRRYQPMHFWPTYTSTTMPEWDPEIRPEEISMRQRWFKSAGDTTRPTNPIFSLDAAKPLVGLDVSASQTQILSIFLGLKKLEACASSRTLRFTDYLAQRAWKQRKTLLRTGVEDVLDYEDAADPRLREAVKNLWMRVWYGSPVPYIIFQHSWEKATYGPGWTSAKAVAKFLSGVPQFKEAHQFLDACRVIAEREWTKDPYRGVIFHDPLDDAEVRWNPVQRGEKNVGSGGRHVIVRAPVGPPNATEDYPVDLDDLSKMIPPCLVHMMDAFYSSLVMSVLAQVGYRDLVGIHDCWLLPDTAGAQGVIQIAQGRVTGEPWLRGLECIYDDLIGYLTGTQYERWMRRIKSRWEKRKQSEGWPFLTSR
jgi:hypothetical protein